MTPNKNESQPLSPVFVYHEKFNRLVKKTDPVIAACKVFWDRNREVRMGTVFSVCNCCVSVLAVLGFVFV